MINLSRFIGATPTEELLGDLCDVIDTAIADAEKQHVPLPRNLREATDLRDRVRSKITQPCGECLESD